MNTKKIQSAPISTPISGKNALDPAWLRWMSDIGDVLKSATSVNSQKSGTETIHYSVNGAIVYINYSGKGGVTLNLPFAVKLKSLVPVSDGTQMALNAGDKTIVIPQFDEEVTIDGYYFTN